MIALGLRESRPFDAGGAQPKSNNSNWSAEERIRFARRKWESTRAAKGTLVEQYLASRGITIPPPALRFASSMFHRESGKFFPAMVAGLQNLEGQFAGISVTFLMPDGRGKAPVSPTRKIYGLLKGNSVRLNSQIYSLAICCEGIETGLSILQATGIPTWAALSATNLPYILLPESIREIIICADNDVPGMTAARALAARCVRKGGRRELLRRIQSMTLTICGLASS